MNSSIEVRRFENPDDCIDMKAAGGISIIKLQDGTAGMRAVFEPGWSWEKDEKPLLGSPDSCPMSHTGYCISGELAVQMVDTGSETHICAGDFFEIPAGHHAHVEGDERV